MKRSCASSPMRARSAAPSGSLCAPYRTMPLDGASSVAAMDSSVDLPDPFGPSSATASPALAWSDTRWSARRRPKCRLTCSSVSSVKSMLTARRFPTLRLRPEPRGMGQGAAAFSAESALSRARQREPAPGCRGRRGSCQRRGSRGGALVQGGVDLFEAGHQLTALGGIRAGIDSTGAMLLLERRQLRQQTFALLLELRASVRRAGAALVCEERTTSENHRRQHQREVACRV